LKVPQLKKVILGGHFWSRGNFCVTSGDVTKEIIEEYLTHYFELKVMMIL
jgi:putative transposase